MNLLSRSFATATFAVCCWASQVKAAPLYVGRWRERSYPNLKKNKKKSDSEPNLKQKACFVDKEPLICSSECHLPQTGQYQRGFSQKT
jgi:hypothetical protein